MKKFKVNKTKTNKKTKNDSNIKFLIPIILGVAVLVMAIFAKNITVKRTMSVTETKTIECTSENYNSRESDAVCGTGYTNVGNTCTATPVYTYTCSGGITPVNGECSYPATIASYTCRRPANGQCNCYDLVGGVTTIKREFCIDSETYCTEACARTSHTGPGSNNGSGDENFRCGQMSDSLYKCPDNATTLGDKCYLYNQSSCSDGWTSIANYSCPNGGTHDGNGNCTYSVTQTQTGTTYSGNITCEKVNDTYTVKYDKNNSNATGTTDDSIHTIDVAKSLTPNGYKLGGNIFRGWNSDANGSGTNYTDQQSVINLTTAGSIITIYAKWEACPAGQYAEAGATECSPCADNTYTSEEGQASCSPCPEGKMANSDHTACVDAVAGTYTVRYNKNNENATGTTANSIHTIDVAKTLTPNGYILEGHIFNGWNKKADGTGTNYTDKQSVINLSVTNGVVIDLYAKWIACPAGQYAEAGATECSPCTGNTYTNLSGQSSCLACPEGMVANSTHTGCINSTSPVVTCPEGTYLTANGTTEEDCATCLEGFYCPGGEFNPSEDDQGKEPCPEGHVDGGAGLSSEESCKIKCNNGYYKKNVTSTSCVACPENTTSDSHFVSFGKTSPDGTCYSEVYKCYVCEENSKKTYTWTNKNLSNTNCKIDTSKDSALKCKAEANNPKTGLFEVGGVLIGLSGIAALAYFAIRKKMISNI